MMLTVVCGISEIAISCDSEKHKRDDYTLSFSCLQFQQLCCRKTAEVSNFFDLCKCKSVILTSAVATLPMSVLE